MTPAESPGSQTNHQEMSSKLADATADCMSLDIVCKDSLPVHTAYVNCRTFTVRIAIDLSVFRIPMYARSWDTEAIRSDSFKEFGVASLETPQISRPLLV